MKKIFSLLLITFFLFICWSSIAGETLQSTNFDTVTATEDFELNVNSNIVISKELNDDLSCSMEFLTGDISKGSEYVTAVNEHIFIAISYSIKNISHIDETFEETVALLYDDKYVYESDNQYFSKGNNEGWDEFTSLEICPLSTVNCKAYFTVPEEVISNTTASLKLNIANCQYTIR